MMSCITLEIWKRAARMLCKCWTDMVSDPHVDEEEPDAECQKRAGDPATVVLDAWIGIARNGGEASAEADT